MSATTREDHVYIAKLAEQAERYTDMVDNMKQVAIMSAEPNAEELTVEERNLLSVAYKNVIGSLRQAWRVVSNLNAGDSESGYKSEYQDTIEAELGNTCDDILNILNQYLIKNAQENESRTFYYKMLGDYYRYKAEFLQGDKKEEAAKDALGQYNLANEVSVNLKVTHPIRLGLALNFSVFYYEILNDPKEACELAKAAFDKAISELESLSEESYKDSTLIMQLLRDNLTLWTSSTDHPPEGEEEGADQKDGMHIQDMENEEVAAS